MTDKLHDLTFTIYPPFREPQLWHLRAYVYGVWAVHKCHPNDSPDGNWHISHAPTGVHAYVSQRKDIAILAAKRLAELEPPSVAVVVRDDRPPRVAAPPIEWFEAAAKALAGLDVWITLGRLGISPADAVDAIRHARAKMVTP